EYVAGIVFAQRCLTPFASLLCPLIRSRTLYQPQVLHRGSVLVENVRSGGPVSVEIKNTKGRQRRIARIKRGQRPVFVQVLVVLVTAGYKIAEVSLEILVEHSRIDRCREIVTF